MRNYFIGLDLAQSHDYTAITVLERLEFAGEFDPVMYARRKETALRLRFLERVARGTPYTTVVERVREVARSPDLAGRCHLIADATGVGAPVVDMLRQANTECRIWPVTITGGEMERYDGGRYNVPKRDLIVGLQMLLQRGELQIAAGLEHSATLVEEMAGMRVRVTPSGHEQYAAWREGEHDDLVLAVALACWGVRKVHPGGRMGDLYWAVE
jgi:hypothetical protein